MSGRRRSLVLAAVVVAVLAVSVLDHDVFAVALVITCAVAILASLWERLAGQGHTAVGVYARFGAAYGWLATDLFSGGSDPGTDISRLVILVVLCIPCWRTLRSLVRYCIRQAETRTAVTA